MSRKVNTESFWCETCQMTEPLTPQQMKEHLASVHQILPPVTGKRKGREFVDFEGGYSQTWDLILAGGVKLTIELRRAGP